MRTKKLHARLCISLSQETFERLQRIAASPLELSLAGVCRVAIEQALPELERMTQTPTKKKGKAQ